MCTALAGRVFLVVRGRFTAGCKLLEDALLLRRLLVVEPVRLAASLSDMFDAWKAKGVVSFLLPSRGQIDLRFEERFCD